MAFTHLRGQFGRVDRMPTIFNETDSHAEKLGFRDALVEACRGIANAPLKDKDPLDYASIERAFGYFVDHAARSADEGVRRQKTIAARGRGDFAASFYCVAKAELFALYAKFTRSERPDLLSPATIRHFVAGGQRVERHHRDSRTGRVNKDPVNRKESFNARAKQNSSGPLFYAADADYMPVDMS
jgi:hypothetical protein